MTALRGTWYYEKCVRPRNHKILAICLLLVAVLMCIALLALCGIYLTNA